MNKKFKKNRRAQAIGTILTFTVIIASLVVIFLFIANSGFGQTTDQQVCHSSVVERSNGVIPAESIPLNCKTHYLCLSKDGTCDEMTSPDIIKVQNKEDVYKALADEMANCWAEFGEGKLNYVGEKLASHLYCSICSQIAFDKSVDFFIKAPSTSGTAITNEIDKAEFYNYLAITNVSGKDMTYLNYLLGLKSAQTIEDALKNYKGSGTSSSGSSVNVNFGTINLSQQYFVVMGIFSKLNTIEWAAVGAVGGIGVIALAIGTAGISIPITLVVVAGAAGGGAGGYFLGTAVSGESGQQFLSPTIVEANSDDFNKLNCASIKTLS